MSVRYKSKLAGFYLLLAGITLFSACKKDKNLSVKETAFSVAFTDPPSLAISKISSGEITFTEINSGNVIKLPVTGNKITATLPEGVYNVTLEATADYTKDGETLTGQIRGYKEGLVAKGTTVSVSVALFLHNKNANFVIKEIFFTGTLTPANLQYNGDKYFVIYNNSDETLYADGLVIAQSTFLTTSKRVYTPDVMAEAFATAEMIMIPGTGKEYPVLPGKSFTVANNAINHLEYNTNSFDLRKADFEMVTTTGDNPEVPNTIKMTTNFAMHNRGFKSYVIARLPGTIEDFKANYAYNYSYIITTTPINIAAFKIPNSWIIDAVNLSVQSEFQWIVTDPSLDMGWTYCGKVDADVTRYGKSVQRKVLSKDADGREILKDTNNSTVDFNAETVPSFKK